MLAMSTVHIRAMIFDVCTDLPGLSLCSCKLPWFKVVK